MNRLFRSFIFFLAFSALLRSFVTPDLAFAGVLVRNIRSSGQNQSLAGSSRTLRSTQVMRMTMPRLNSVNYNGIADYEKQRQADYKYQLDVYKLQLKQYETQKKEAEKHLREKQKERTQMLREAKRNTTKNSGPREKGFFGKLISGEPTSLTSSTSNNNPNSNTNYESTQNKNSRVDSRTRSFSSSKERERTRNDDAGQGSSWSFWAWLRRLFFGY